MEKDVNPKQAKNFVRKMRIASNTILLIKQGSDIADKVIIDNLSRAINEMKISNVLVMVVKDLDGDIAVLDKSIMNKHGWFRLQDINSLLRAPHHAEPAKPPTV